MSATFHVTYVFRMILYGTTMNYRNFLSAIWQLQGQLWASDEALAPSEVLNGNLPVQV